jgi:hypothetical protein
LGAAALAEINAGREENERQELQNRLGELPNPEEMEKVPDDPPVPESLGGAIDADADDQDELEDCTSVAENTVTLPKGEVDESEVGEGFTSLKKRADDLAEDIEEEQSVHKEKLSIEQSDEVGEAAEVAESTEPVESEGIEPETEE